MVIRMLTEMVEYSHKIQEKVKACLLYTSDAADEVY